MLSGEIPPTLMFYKESPIRTVVWHSPPQQKEVLFAEHLKIKSGLYWIPGLIWISKGTSVSIYAYKKFDGLKTVLFDCPFPNSDGFVCFGAGAGFLKQERMKTFERLIKNVETVYWMTRFTHEGTNLIKEKNYNFLMNHLVDRDEQFPLSVLIETKKTIKNEINEVEF